MLDTISNIIVGIRYAKSFRILDVSGEIIDNILYNSESPFGTEFFPKVTEGIDREKILLNPETKNVLRINTDDLIIRIQVEDFEKDFNKLTEKLIPYLSDEIFQNYKIQNIHRLGVIYGHSLPETKEMGNVISTFSKQNIEEPNNVRLYFSQKLPQTEARFKKGVNDYFNTIYTFTQMEKGLAADLDFQRYFIPDVGDIRDSEPEQFLVESKKFLAERFHSWLKEYGKKSKTTQI